MLCGLFNFFLKFHLSVPRNTRLSTSFNFTESGFASSSSDTYGWESVAEGYTTTLGLFRSTNST